MRIGVDFDNTLAGYDHLFAEAARGRGWTEVPLDRGKQALRDALRAGPDGENNWRSLQAEVYGARMAEAKLMDGVADFFGHCRERGVTVSIVSHKTRYAAADPGGVDLHTASLDWMRLQGFFGEGFGIDPAQVFFEASRAEKLARIAALECTHFIDDLEEVLLAPEFPKGVKRYLIGVTAVDAPGLTSCGNWRNITEDIFGRNPV
jgi:hypothetical protein|tara:strand:- start:310 stop:924 length:615 start_codon:yes stop_codon:yes gene_type:complete